jgi:hypothetical protein
MRHIASEDALHIAIVCRLLAIYVGFHSYSSWLRWLWNTLETSGDRMHFIHFVTSRQEYSEHSTMSNKAKETRLTVCPFTTGIMPAHAHDPLSAHYFT